MEKETLREVDLLLDRVEKDKDVELLHAVESGSRAWGFPSTDSDYDVRFVYVRPTDWYLSVFERSDVLGPVFDGELDASGWDLLKFLRLMAKGNAVTFEWLNSPMVYRSYTAEDGSNSVDKLRELAKEVFNPLPVFYHYKSMTKRKVAEASTDMTAKSYLYGLRAALSARWVEEERTAPPLEFALLRDRYLSEVSVDDALTELLERKSKTAESSCRLANADLLKLLSELLDQLESYEVKSSPKVDPDRYDEVYRSLLIRE